MLDFICNGSVDLFGTGRERKIQKWKYMSPAGFEPTPRQSTTGKSAPWTARPPEVDGDQLFNVLQDNGIQKNCYATTSVNGYMCIWTECRTKLISYLNVDFS